MPVNFKNIKTTRGREYDDISISELNDSLSYLPPIQRATVLGSVIEESGGDPLAKSKNGTYQGLLQWGADRYRISSDDSKEEFKAQLSKIRTSLNDTVSGIEWTHGGSGSGYNSFRDTYNGFHNPEAPLEDVYRAFSFGYVRSKGKEDSYNNRLKVAQQVYDRIKQAPNNNSMLIDRLEELRTSNPLNRSEGGQIQRHKSWNELSLSEKSEMIKVAVMNGITDLPTIKEKYNEFAEGGDTKELWTMEDEAKYREWRNSLPDNLRLTNDNDYDMRGAFKAGMQPTLESDGLYHLGSRDPETGRILKAPHHPTYLQAINTDARMGYYPMVDDKGQTYTQTWEGNLFADGGIHIKPENRGKFTALKERTGHSATWFKEHGTPAQKKMAIFALNARKWKHGFGGPLVENAMAHYYDGISEDTQQIEVPDNTYVYKSPMFSSITPELSREAALNRTNNVFSNYDEAIDAPLSTTETNIRNTARWAKDNIWEGIPSGVSNCTLTTTQWVDPTKPVNKAASIVNAPSLYNYQTINQEQAVPGDILISRNPNNDTYHTMLVTGFADKPGIYDFDGTPYKFDAGEPLLTYSKGGHDVSFIRRDIPLSVYTPNSDGKIENHFFRYKYPKERFLPEIVITPNR